MKTLIARDFGSRSVLELVDDQIPAIGSHEVLIKVGAAALNRIDLSVRAGYLVDAGLVAPADRYFFGWDVAGTVEAIGAEVTLFRVGEPVIGLRDILSARGTHAEFVALTESAVAHAPSSIDTVSAAALPLALLTADGALRATELEAGASLLVTGAGGVIGRLVIQLAAMRGITTIAHGRTSDLPELQSTHATVATDTNGSLASVARAHHPDGVDAVIDCATLAIRAHDALRPEGRFVSLVRPFSPPPLRGTTVVVHETHADGASLGELAALVDTHGIGVKVADTYPLQEAAAAHEHLAGGGVRGRLVLVP